MRSDCVIAVQGVGKWHWGFEKGSAVMMWTHTSGEIDFGRRSRLSTAFHNSNEEVEAAIHEYFGVEGPDF